MLLVLLLLVVIASAAAVALCGHGAGTLSDRGVWRGSAPVVLRSLAALAGAGACALYAWGLLILCGAVMTAQDGGADSSPPRPCRTPGYSVTFVPLGFVCETTDGDSHDSYDSGYVPGYLNPAVLALALTGAGCAIGSGYASELRTRAGLRKGGAG
ncbi:hypothetical protein [Streptomyces sp. HD]|uniref:hypothetical protein n=1 Tax=Streptomyces sp. HD TaxID=3020892 RepID=UPI00232CF70E|nr:hypothetical protein [Streptomyces sp. HD]MDC0769250.1 hypothetical protein [Streptomyces sp. HD]